MKLTGLLTPYKNLPREIYILFLSKMINAMGCFVMPLMTLILTKKIHLSTEAAGFYLAIGGLAFIPASMVGGKLADLIGRKKVIIIFETISAILYITCGFMEPSINMVYLIILASFFMVASGPAHDSLIADLTTPENRSGAYSLGYLGWNLGFAAGPIIGGFLFKNHLPLVFIGDALTALIALSLILFFVKDTLHLTKIEITDENRKAEVHETGSIFKVLLKRPILLYFAAIAFGYNFVYAQWSFMMPIHADLNFGKLGAQYYGTLASFNGLVVILFTPLITKFFEKTNNIKKMVYGGILYAVGFGVLGVISSLPIFFLSVLIFTLGEILLTISFSPFIANHTPVSHRGRMSGMLSILMGMGFTLAPLIMGKVLMVTTIAKGWLIVGAIALVSTIFMKILEVYDNKDTTSNDDELESSEIC